MFLKIILILTFWLLIFWYLNLKSNEISYCKIAKDHFQSYKPRKFPHGTDFFKCKTLEWKIYYNRIDYWFEWEKDIIILNSKWIVVWSSHINHYPYQSISNKGLNFSWTCSKILYINECWISIN